MDLLVAVGERRCVAALEFPEPFPSTAALTCRMVLFLATLVGFRTTVMPIDGPAFPLKMVHGLTKKAVHFGGNWTNGVYDVSFSFQSSLSVFELAKRYRREVPGSQSILLYNGSYSNTRTCGSTSQYCLITQNLGAGTQPLTTVSISEYAKPMEPTPSRWYWKAIAVKPPIPLIAVPFEPSITAQSVSLVNLEGLLSPRAGNKLDAAAFSAHIGLPFAVELKKAKAWFAKNGYRKVATQAWFKPNVRVFEITIGEDLVDGKRKGTSVVMYFTNKQNDRPITFQPMA